MSLKAFHILFISISILLSIGVGASAIRDYVASGNGGSLAFGIVFFFAGFLLVVYGWGFLRKMREIEA